MLPGEPRSKWREVIGKWIGYIPQWSGLKEGFKTDYIEAHTMAPREMWNETLEKKLEETLGGFLLPGEDGTLNTSVGEFFDELTSYPNIIIPGVAKTDLTAFYAARDAYDQVEVGREADDAFLAARPGRDAEPSIRFDGWPASASGAALLGRRAVRGDPRRRACVRGRLRGTGGRHRTHAPHGRQDAVAPPGEAGPAVRPGPPDRWRGRGERHA